MEGLKITVITVVYNAAPLLQATIDSVTSQDYDNIEYIIKDGGSKDGTLDIIVENAKKYPYIRYVSEIDQGLYYAMNTALDMATGDVVEFLNAGDRFASKDVISRAIKIMEKTGADVVYGDIIYESPDGGMLKRVFPSSCSLRAYYLTGDSINHQAMFIKMSLFSESRFDTSFRICADREWMMRSKIWRPKRQMVPLGFLVAIYPVGGISDVEKERYKEEASLCIRKHMPWGYPIFALFELFRNNDKLARLLHKIYNLLYVR